MKLGFYYHTTIGKRGSQLWIPSYLGVFLDSLADNVDQLFLFMHEVKDINDTDLNYALKAENIQWINLGVKTPAWHRSIFHKRILREVKNQLPLIDAILVRGPSPLAPFFSTFSTQTRLFYLVVGDYGESVIQGTGRGLRARITDLYLNRNQKQFEKALLKARAVLVNSAALFEKYHSLSCSVNLVKTTTLVEADIMPRVDSMTENLAGPIRLVFTGRINWQKGLRELIATLIDLKDGNPYPVLDIVGWEDQKEKPVEIELMRMVSEAGIADRLIFHGKKSVGEELNYFYRQAHIYVLPTYHEGFPRTIWEAMANGTPVITTTVGSIPHYLRNEVDSLLIEPKDAKALMESIKRLSEDGELRRRLIFNGLRLAKANTLEIQSQLLLQTIEEHE